MSAILYFSTVKAIVVLISGVYVAYVLIIVKGDPISESFSLWLQSPKNHCPEHLLFWLTVLRIVIWHLFFEDWIQNEKLSEIKPPLIQNALGLTYISYIHAGYRTQAKSLDIRWDKAEI